MSENGLHLPWVEYVRFKEDLAADYEQALRTIAAVPKIMEGLEGLEVPPNPDRTVTPIGPRPYRRRR